MTSDEYSSVQHDAIMLARSLRTPPYISFDDLVSAGLLGYVDAIRRYDPGKGASLRTFTHFRMRGAMLDYLKLRSTQEVRTMEKVQDDVAVSSQEIEQWMAVYDVRRLIRVSDLTPQERCVIELLRLLEMDAVTVADGLGVSVQQVYKLCRSAIAKMRVTGKGTKASPKPTTE